jgi:hypothetical protein
MQSRIISGGTYAHACSTRSTLALTGQACTRRTAVCTRMHTLYAHRGLVGDIRASSNMDGGGAQRRRGQQRDATADRHTVTQLQQVVFVQSKILPNPGLRTHL